MNPVIELDIVKLAAGIYEVYCQGQTSNTTHDSISDALRHYGEDVPANFAQFANVNYDGVSLGTKYIPSLARDAEQLANDLVDLVHAVHLSVEEMKVLNAKESAVAVTAGPAAAP